MALPPWNAGTVRGLRRQGNPHVRALQLDAAEIFGRNADDSVGLAGDVDLLSDNVGISPELSAPEPVTDDGHSSARAQPILIRHEESSHKRCDAQQSEIR